MFREIARKNQQLSKEECFEILSSSLRGVLSVNGEDFYPYSMPINHFYNKEDGRIYFHCGKEGYRTDCLNLNNKVSFCVMNDGEKVPGEWYLIFKSVIVFGTVEFVDDKEKILEISRMLSYKFTSDENYIKQEIENYLDNTALFCINIEHITGKTVKEC